MCKKLVAMVISTLLIVSIAGCSNENKPDTKPNDSQSNVSADDIMGDKYLSDNSESNSDDEQDLGAIIGESDDSNSNSDSSLGSNIVDIVVIDCNGSDSTLIHSDLGNILIDFGSKDSIESVKNVLDNKGIKDINLAILTHAHSDHYGGLFDIIDSYNIDKLVMTNTGDISTEYENTIRHVKENNIDIDEAKVGSTYKIGDIDVKIIGPSIDYEEADENSIVTLLKYKDFDMLVTGGAGMIAEKDYVNYLSDIEVFTVGRHGNSSTTSDNLLEKATPNIGIISCSTDNVSQELLDKLAKYNINVFRTDKDGTITIKTDGRDYNVVCNDNEQRYTTDENYSDDNQNNTNNNSSNIVTSNEINQENTATENESTEYVYTSPTSKYYHSTDKCAKLLIAREVNKVSLKDAIDAGNQKCPRCW